MLLDHIPSFWAARAQELIHWNTPFEHSFSLKEGSSNPFDGEWFKGGMLNASYQTCDRHAETSPNKKALIWESENGEARTVTYAELRDSVVRVAEVYKRLGLSTGDVVALYMPLVPETIFAMLAAARLGITHTVVFAGFSARALADRLIDSGAKLLITADFTLRRGQKVSLLDAGKEALLLAQKDGARPDLLLLRREESSTQPTVEGARVFDWQDLVQNVKRKEPKAALSAFPSNHPLFILYTSGSTGKPKGILHGTGGYLLQSMYSFMELFEWKRDSEDIFWCSADPGWITGHTYLAYGPLAAGATAFIYEGALDFPHANRAWELIDRYKINVFYTAPTAIRHLMRVSDPSHYSFASLRLLGSVGEPINPKVWLWYQEHIGRGECRVIDTWWQTETGSAMIAPLPGHKTKPGSAATPFHGILPKILSEDGKPGAKEGYLVISFPWPSMALGIWKDQARFRSTYLDIFPGYYFTGDGARVDEDGHYWILGRVDDVINVSGHRLSTAEIESSLVGHPSIVEAAVVAISHEITGQAIAAFAIPRDLGEDIPALAHSLRMQVVKDIGSLAKPAKIYITKGLPKTRSGKIMRRFLRQIGEGKEPEGDMSTLEDPCILTYIKGLEAY